MASILTQEQLKKVIDDYISKLKGKLSIDQIILFGSYAKGDANKWSDIDLYIVSKDLPENELKGNNGFYLDCLVQNFDTRIETVGINPKQLSNSVEKSFFEEVKSTGKIIKIN